MVLKHVLNLQILENNKVCRVYKFPGNLMTELISEIGYTIADIGELDLGFLAIPGTELLAVQRFLSRPILFLGLDIILGIVEGLPFRGGYCMLYPQIHAECGPRFDLNRIYPLRHEYYKPSSPAISFEGAGLDFSLDWPMHKGSDGSWYFGKS